MHQQNKQQTLVKWRLLLQISDELGHLIANKSTVSAEGDYISVWAISEYENPEEIYLLRAEDIYWLAQLETASNTSWII